ncbi:MAG: tetratricopeptide repeat protein [Vampirovibrio sp.]
MALPSLDDYRGSLKRGACFWVDLRPAYLTFSLEGQDVADYLHRRSTNDVHALRVGEGQLNSFLNKTANIQCIFQLWREGDTRFIVLVEASLADSFEAEVNRFKIMEVFDLRRELGSTLFLELNGISSTEQAPDVKPLTLTHPTLLLGDSASIGRLHRDVPSSTSAVSWVPFETFYEIQTLCGVPHYGQDYTQTTKLPEVTWESMAVSYSKGCFLGQETLAKVKTYGGLNQTLMGVWMPDLTRKQFKATIHTPLDVLKIENGEVRTIESVGSWGSSVCLNNGIYALAFLPRHYRKPQEILTLQIGTETVQAVIDFPPFLRLGGTPEEQAARRYAFAMQAFVAGDLEGSLQEMRQITQDYPLYWQAQEGQALLLGRLERYEEAMQVLLTLVQQNPNWLMAYTNLSIYALKLGSKEEAETWKAEGTRVTMRLKMAERMAEKKAQVPANEVLPENVEADLARQNQLKERVSLFEKALEFSPQDALAHYGLATALQELESYAPAVHAYEKTLELNPKHSKAYVGLAECWFALGNKEALNHVILQGIEVASIKGDLQPLARLKEIRDAWQS